MPGDRSVGPAIAVLGLALLLAGLLIATGAFTWFGLGDIRIQRPHVQIFIPLTTMIVLSLALSALFMLLGRLFGRR